MKSKSDDKTKQDGRDDSRVSESDSYELAYLEEKFGVTREQVKEAIEQVGNDREAVEEYLRDSD